MTEVQSVDLSRLRVFTNRGTVAYPLTASGEDPSASSLPAPPDTDEGPSEHFGFNEPVSEEILAQLGAVLFGVDSRRGTAWCYFRAHTDRPIQLTAECFGEDAADALESLPALVESYIADVRGGSVVDPPPGELPPDDDGVVYAALSHRGTIELPWSEDVVRRIITTGQVDITAPSLRDAVNLARYLGTVEELPPLRAVVTKGERTDVLADVDVVIRVGNVDELSFDDPTCVRDARLALAGSRLRDAIAPAQEAVAPFEDTRGLRCRLAREAGSVFSPLGLSVKPKRQYVLQLLVAGLVGFTAGLIVVGGVAIPSTFPTVGDLREGGRGIVAVIASWLAVNPWIATSIVGSGGLIGVAIAAGWFPQPETSGRLRAWRASLGTSTRIPSGDVLLLGALCLVLVTVSVVIGYTLWLVT